MNRLEIMKNFIEDPQHMYDRIPSISRLLQRGRSARYGDKMGADVFDVGQMMPVYVVEGGRVKKGLEGSLWWW